MKYPFKFLIVFFLIHSCANTKQQSNEKELPPKIVFLTYNIKKKTEKDTEIVFLKHQIVEGKIKNFENNSENQTEGDLICSFLDKKKNVLQVIYIKNPLVKIVEFVNDSGSLEKRVFELDSTQFVIRTPYIENTKLIEVSEVSLDKKLKKLLTSKL